MMDTSEYYDRSQAYSDELHAVDEKPKSAVVFGVLSIVFGSWGLLGLVMSVIMLLVGPRGEIQRELQLPPHIQVPMLSIGFGLSLFLLITGIRLLKATLAARKAFLVYCKYGSWIAVFNWLSSGGADILHPAGRRKEVRSV
jgi:hypothetical protein